MGWTAEPTGIFEQTAPGRTSVFHLVDMVRYGKSQGPKKNQNAGVDHFTCSFLEFLVKKNRASHGWFRLRVSVGRFGTVGIGSLPGMMILTAIDYIEVISCKRKTMEKTTQLIFT